MTRVVIDANVLASATVGHPDSPSCRLLGALASGRIDAVLCARILEELNRALQRRSILARVADPVFVRDYLGHSKLSTTDRYVGAKHRPEDFERLNRAFNPPPVAASNSDDRSAARRMVQL